MYSPAWDRLTFLRKRVLSPPLLTSLLSFSHNSEERLSIVVRHVMFRSSPSFTSIVRSCTSTQMGDFANQLILHHIPSHHITYHHITSHNVSSRRIIIFIVPYQILPSHSLRLIPITEQKKHALC